MVPSAGNKIRLFLVSPMPPPAGGIQTFTQALMSYFSKDGDDIELVMYDTSHRLRPATSQSQVVRILTGLHNSMSTFIAVRKVVRNSTPDIIHLSSSSGFSLIKDLMIIRFARKRNIPVIMHWHFGRIPEIISSKNWEWKMINRVIRSCTESIVLDAASFNSLSGLNLRNIHMIPNPLPSAVEMKASELVSGGEIFNIKQRNTGRVIFVGHIIKEKGIYELIEACSDIPSVKELVLIGHYRQSVHSELRRKASGRIDSWLQMPGELSHDKVLEFMSQSSVLALPSYTEGFPMVILEAMSLGCAVISTDVGAIPEMLAVSSDKPCGKCVSARDVENLRRAIVSLCEDHEQTRIMGQNGIKRVLQYYSLKSVLKQYKALWYQCLNRQ